MEEEQKPYTEAREQYFNSVLSYMYGYYDGIRVYPYLLEAIMAGKEDNVRAIMSYSGLMRQFVSEDQMEQFLSDFVDKFVKKGGGDAGK